MCDERNHKVSIKISPRQMDIQANNPELGDVQEKNPIKYEYEEEESIEIGLNATYLIDSLSIFEDEDGRI